MAFDSINHVLANTGVFRCKSDETWRIDKCGDIGVEADVAGIASPGQTTQDMLVSVIRSGFRDATDIRSFEARMIPTPWWSQCGLWFHIKSAPSVIVAIFVFVSALRCTRIFHLFSKH